MSNPVIRCEGSVCNQGVSASDMFLGLMAGKHGDEAEKSARRSVTDRLVNRAHRKVREVFTVDRVDPVTGVQHGHSNEVFACVKCGHERIYG